MRYLYHPLLLSMILFLAGCGITPKSPAVHDFGVARSKPEDRSGTLPDITVDAPKWLADNRIRYRLLYAAPTQIRCYTLDRWIAPPTELLEQQLESEGKTLSYPLVIRLLDFEQQYDAPNQSRVLIHFSAEAYASDHKKKLGTQEFRLERLTKTPDALGAVTAFSELAQQAAGRIQTWLSGLAEP